MVYLNFNKSISFFKEKFRINSLNFFADNIRPEWEDDKNKKGHTLTLQYEIKNQSEIQEFFDVIQQNWIYLILLVIGGSIVGSEFV
ncbi:eukaryotic translation initiation factor EIF4E family protein [archaeon]|nr:eukaryotic translation initiation factor EIF4E family protein [archaeon]